MGTSGFSAPILAKALVFLALAPGALGYAAPKEDSQLICRFKMFPPGLAVEFNFHVKSQFRFPLKQFCDAPTGMHAEIRFEPVNHSPGKPSEWSHQVKWAPDEHDCRKGNAILSYGIWTGVGQYRATWRFRDMLGRSCQGSHEFNVALSRSDREVAMSLPPGTILHTPIDLFHPEPGTDCSHLTEPRYVKVFINTDVMTRNGLLVETGAADLRPHLAALRRLARSEMFNRYSLVAFSFEEQGIVARQDFGETIDFRRLGESIDDRNLESLGSRLARRSSISFLTSLISVELLEGDLPDAMVFIGHDADVVPHGTRFSDIVVNRLHSIDAVFTFMTTDQYFPFRGVIGTLVHQMKGVEHTLREPKDIETAVDALEDLAIKSGLR